MKRSTTNKINYFLDHWIPPRIRDCKWLMGIVFRVILGPKYKYYMEFKEKALDLSEKEINRYYEILADTFMKRETDLNDRCMQYILKSVIGPDILDAAAGKGYLIRQIQRKRRALKEKGNLYAVDIVLPKEKMEGIQFYQASLTSLPFADRSFDTVICTHALEHIKDCQAAINELRRVCRKRLIIVLPRQREYQYTFDLHIHFFTYQYHVRSLLKGNNVKIWELGHDWICIEDM